MNTFARRLALATLLSSAIFAAQADNTAQAVPFNQNWTNTGQITANDNWSGVPGIEGFLGQDITTGTGADPQTLTTTSGAANDLSVLANQTSTSVTNGDVIEFHTTDPVVGLQGSGTADAPYVLIHLDTTGKSGITVGYSLRDVDGSTDNAVQPVALQYRVGNSGAFVNVPAGFVADASTGPSLATLVTPVLVALPAAADNQPLVQVRIITANAVGNDESIGIDDIAIGSGGLPPVLSIADQARRERNAMSQSEAFPVQLSQPAGAGGVSFSYTVTAGTATAGVDYIGSGGNVTIPEGSSAGFVSFAITGDTDIEGDETVLVTLGNIVGAVAGDTSAVITISDDDAPPPISISDTATTEGDSGTKQFLFTISLGSPAPQGGVSVDYATADGTAAAGSDYVAASATASIAEGQTSITIGVHGSGDVDIEGDETFFVNLSNAVGGTIADGQGVGTISNDDFPITPIHDIQGSGATSPHVGQQLYTRGIVTGRKGSGFFMQAADAEADADPATSEGIFVFTSTTPPAAAAVGNLVRVAATVVEFVPGADPGQAPMTELSFATVTQLSTGNGLPAAVALTPTFPDPAGAIDQLERLEGMRVTAASFTVVAATGGNTNEPSATGTSNGIFNVVVTGVPRPFREPGIQAPDLPPSGSIPPIPRWDFNPELLTVDSDALGALIQNVSTGATITGLTGPLDFGFRRYTVLAEATPVVTGGLAPTPARVPTADEFTVAGYNLERFFDTVNDPGIGEPVLTETAFANRLNKASLAIRDYLNTPDIIGVVEVENLSTLQMLATRISTDALAAGQPNPQYVAYLMEGNDVGGIDVGFLVKAAEVGAGVARIEVESVVQHGKATTWLEPDGSTSLLNDRPPLLLDAVVHYADGRTFPITVIVVHQRSLNGAEEATASGERIRAKRQEQAEFLAALIDGMQAADPLRRITVLGDFNAFEFNDGYVDAMHVVEGIPVPDDQTVVPGDGIDLVNPDLLNLAALEDEGQRYSFVFDGNAQSLDHVLVNQVLGADVDSFDLDHARINADFPETNRNDANSPSRLADHDPAVAYFLVGPYDSDLQAAARSTVSPAGLIEFVAEINNQGPGAAYFPGIGLAFSAEFPGLSVAAPAGWSCDDPVVASGVTSVACNATSLASGAIVEFSALVDAPSANGEPVHMVVAVTSSSIDPDSSNNDATAMVGGQDTTDLGVDWLAPAQVARSSASVNVIARVANPGTDTALQPHIAVAADVHRSSVLLTTPAGWNCEIRDIPVFRAECTSLTGVLAPGTIDIPLEILHPGQQPQIALRAGVSSLTADPVYSNNAASTTMQIVGER